MPQNLIQHIEWTTPHSSRLRTFFTSVFDWTFREAMPGYTLIDGIGGIFAATDPQMPNMITPYVNVRDLDVTEKKITAAGGRIHKSKQEVPGMGWFTLFTDPDGNMIGLWQPMNPMRQAAAKKPAKRASKKAAKKAAKKTSAKKATVKKATARKRGAGARRR